MPHAALRAVDALGGICGPEPALGQFRHARRGLELHGWNTGPVEEVHIPENDELIVSLHLAGARQVRLFTEHGLSRSVSRPGDLTLMPRGKPISFQTRGMVQFVTVHFAAQGGSRRHAEARARIMNQSQCLFAFRDDYVLSTVKALMNAGSIAADRRGSYLETLLESMVVHLANVLDRHLDSVLELPASIDHVDRRADFDALLRFIDQRLSEKLTLEDLAEYAGISRAAFARSFSAHFRCSPHQFLIHRRIERAKQLLAQGFHTCADVAYEVGFSGQSHFSTTFKAIEGVTPIVFSNKLHKNSG